MPRLNVIEPERAPKRIRAIFDELERKMGRVANIFQGLANSPAALKAYLSMSQALAEGELSPQDREAVYLAVSQLNECRYCVSAHTLLGRRVGLSDDEIIAIRRFAPTSDKHKALLSFVQRVIDTKGFVHDDDVAVVRDAGYSDGQIAETIGYIALATYSNLFNHVFDTPLDFPAAPEL